MTEKRFTMIYFETDGNLIFDETKHDGEWYDSTECLQDQQIVDLLNEQHKEIERLENKLGRARNRIRRQSKDLDKYFDYFRRELNWDCERILEEVFK